MTGTVAYGDFAAQQAGVSGAVGAGIVPPANVEAERGLLGALLIDARAIEEVAEILDADAFYWPAHQRIYRAITTLHERGIAPTATILHTQFTADGDLETVGGAAYLAELAAAVITVVNARDYALTIRDLAVRRALIAECGEVIADARGCDSRKTATALIEALEGRLFGLGETRGGGSRPEPVSAGIAQALEMIDRAQRGESGGLMTGIAALDRHLNGMWPGDLILVGGRPSMGKTVKALTIAHNVATAGKRVLFFNLEMSAAQLSLRLMARRSGMPVQPMLRQGDLSAAHFREIAQAGKDLARLPLVIDETAGLSAAQIRTRARRHKRQFGLDLIIIDYLGLMMPPEGINSKVYELAEITKALKIMAKDLGVPVVLLHQLNRGVEARDGKRPQLSDLRDSGAIEQDADVVLLLYREEYYLSRNLPEQKAGETREKFADRVAEWEAHLAGAKGKAEIIVAKFRQGECGIVPVAFHGVRQCFADFGATEFN